MTTIADRTLQRSPTDTSQFMILPATKVITEVWLLTSIISPYFSLLYMLVLHFTLPPVGPQPWLLICTISLYWTVLYCTVLDCIVEFGIGLYCTVLYWTVLYCTVSDCTLLYCTLLDCTVLYWTVLYCTVLYWTVLYSTVLYWTILYCTALDCTVQFCTWTPPALTTNLHHFARRYITKLQYTTGNAGGPTSLFMLL